MITHVAFVLDRSGSMQNIREETVTVVNQQLEKVSEVADRVTLVTFSTEVDAPRFIGAKEPLQTEDYKPLGWTALYDAIGDTITMLQQVEQQDEDTAFLVVVITDGQENMSKRFNRSRLASLIKELQDSKKWTFVYLGTKQDLFRIEQELNIPFGNVETFDRDTVADVYTNSPKFAAGLSSYNTMRGTGGSSMSNFFGKPI